VGEDRRALGGIGDVAGDVAAGERLAGGAQLEVAADVIGVDVGVDDVADRLHRRVRIAVGDDGRARLGAEPRPERLEHLQPLVDAALQLLDRRDDAIGVRREAGVDHQHAVLADRQRDVAAGAGEQVDVAAHVDDFQVRLPLRLLSGAGRRHRDHGGGDNETLDVHKASSDRSSVFSLQSSVSSPVPFWTADRRP
jgi:hypothetical protein